MMFYVGLNSAEESVLRIANRVRKGGHDIPEEYVRLRYQNRIGSLKRVLPLCDEVVFYDNENGFVKVAEIKNNTFYYTNGYRRIGLWRLSRLFADHIPDHNALWGTRKQCGKERQRATFPE